MPMVPIKTHRTPRISPTSSCFKGSTRSQLSVDEHGAVITGKRRETVESDGDHAAHIGIHLLRRRTRLQPADRLIAEITEKHFGAVFLQRQQQRRLQIEEAKVLRQHSDHLPGPSVNRQASSDHGLVSSEARLPVSEGQDHRFGSPRRIVGARKDTTQHRLDFQQRQNGIGHVQFRHLLRLCQAGHGGRAVVPHSDVLECPVLFTIGEIEEWRYAGVGHVIAKRRVIERNQCFRLRIRQRLQQNPFDHAENSGVRADANGQRRHCDGREHGGMRQPPQNVPQSHEG